MPISWNILLVFLSVLIAMIGSFSALEHAQRMRACRGRAAMLWMLFGGFTLGATIWSMHFIGMLALHLPIPLAYDPWWTLLSMLPAVAASALCFRVLREREISSSRILISSLLMGGGISLMHYTGMVALQLSPPVSYDSPVIVLSVLIAWLAAWGALQMMYHGGRVHLPPLARNVLGGLVMGAAISGMHYVAMWGIHIQDGSICLTNPSYFSAETLAILIALSLLFWFAIGLLVLLFDQRLSVQKEWTLRELEEAHADLQERAKRQAEEMTQTLRDSEERIRLIISRALDAIITINEAGAITGWNEEAQRTFGYSPMEVTGRDLADLIVPERFREAHRTGLARLLKTGVPKLAGSRIELSAIHRDGREFPVELSIVAVPQGKRMFFSAFLRDISARKNAEQALKASLSFSESLLQAMPVPVFYKDAQGRYTGCNTAFERFIGISKSDLIGKTVFDISSQPLSAEYRDRDVELLESEEKVQVYESSVQHADGTLHHVVFHKAKLMDAGGNALGIVGAILDISERKQSERQIHKLAFYDALTNLPNRRLLMDRLQHVLASSARSGQHAAVMFLDLDHFKVLNDTKGHGVGDLLLVEVARRLEACVREEDTVARLGGDEFVLVLESLSSVEDEAIAQAEKVAEKIRAELELPFQLGGYEHNTTPSIGVVLCQGTREAMEDILRHADTAMYQAKGAGRNAIRFYDPAMQAAIEAKADMAAALRYALERRQLNLLYQTQVNSLGQIVGAEALLRWRHPELGELTPEHFIHLAEEQGLIDGIGYWVLRTACTLLQEWQEEPDLRELVLAVNVSAQQFHSPDFVAQVERILREAAVKPFRLKLEITESTVLDDTRDTIEKMRDLKVLGVSFSMDDFGTGYSSLQYLKHLPLDQIKIDKSFVRDVDTNENDAVIVRTIIAMSEALGLDVVAEGVETRNQLERLQSHGCHIFQGYYFSQPVHRVELMAALRNLHADVLGEA